ncbi:hypothetical protein ACO0QE_004050 [Hanseniaspora vineae]
MSEKKASFEDIVELLIPYLLSTADFYKISCLNKKFQAVLTKYFQNDLYQITFGHDPVEQGILQARLPSSSNWLELYKKRLLRSKFYTWGSCRNARLGFTVQSLDLNDLSQRQLVNGLDHRSLAAGLNAPFKVPFGKNLATHEGDAIIDLSSGGFSIQVLTSDGKLYSTGQSYHGGHRVCGPENGEMDYGSLVSLLQASNVWITKLLSRYNTSAGVAGRFGTTAIGEQREEIADRLLHDCLGDNPYVKRMVNYPHSLEEIRDVTQFVKISSGRSHFLALGVDGYIYTWDGPDVVQGIKLEFEDNAMNSPEYPVRSIRCGWDFNSCYRYGLGIIIWKNRKVVDKSDKFFAKCSECTLVPETEYIEDYIALQDERIAYIDNKNGALHVYHRGTDRILISSNVSKIQGFRDNLAVFLNDSKVFVCKIDRLELKKLQYLTLPHGSIESIQFGDYHVLLLSSEGKVYSFGTDSQHSGCLGLGSSKHVCEDMNVGTMVNFQDFKVAEPQLVKINLSDNYCCVKLSAGGWHSCAVIM